MTFVTTVLKLAETGGAGVLAGIAYHLVVGKVLGRCVSVARSAAVGLGVALLVYLAAMALG